MTNARWTPADMPDLGGLTAVVTGANSGLGLHTSTELARHGARVVMACRDPERGDEALGQVRVQAPGADVALRRLDLADLASVRDFAAEVVETFPTIDVLVNNAGVMALPQRRTTADGFEMQLGTNHLGHYALTGLLLPALMAAPSRVVTVSSFAHRSGTIAFDDLQLERAYRPWTAYGQSKLANLLFAMELQRRADAASAEVTSVAAHPGFSTTNLVASGPGSHSSGSGGSGNGGLLSGARNLWSRTLEAGTQLLGQSAERGAWPSLYAASAPGVRGAEYFGPDSLGGTRGHPVRAVAKPSAYDPDVAARLWDVSATLTGVTFDFSR